MEILLRFLKALVLTQHTVEHQPTDGVTVSVMATHMMDTGLCFRQSMALSQRLHPGRRGAQPATP